MKATRSLPFGDRKRGEFSENSRTGTKKNKYLEGEVQLIYIIDT